MTPVSNENARDTGFSWWSNPRALPWLWVPTLYLFEGIPNSLVERIGPVLLQDLGVAKASIPGIIATAALPWALKPFWSPLIDLYKTKRFWVWSFQLLSAVLLFGLAWMVFHGVAPTGLLVALGAVAFLSATHDIAADGFYLHGLDVPAQSYFVGIRSTAFRIGPIFAQGVLVGCVGLLVVRGEWQIGAAWAMVLAALGVLLLLLAGYHRRILPYPESDRPVTTPARELLREFFVTWVEFFRQKGILELIAFFLFFRLAEVQLLRIATIFLKDERSAGGLGLDNEAVALVYGTLGAVALIVGGILGGILAARYGLRKLIWPIVVLMHTPNLAFIGLAHWQPVSLGWIGGSVVLEQFGYGLGYTAFSIVMLRIGKGPRRAAHFAFATGLAYLGYVIPGYWVGALQKAFGYEYFFWWVIASTIPGFIVTWRVVRKTPIEA